MIDLARLRLLMRTEPVASVDDPIVDDLIAVLKDLFIERAATSIATEGTNDFSPV